MKIVKILKVLLIFIIIICLLEPSVHAKEILDLGKDRLNLGKETAKDSDYGFGTDYDKVEIFAGVLRGAAIFIIIGAGMVMGIKYLVSPVEKRAELKKALIAYAIGSIVALGALGIWKLLVNTFQSIV